MSIYCVILSSLMLIALVSQDEAERREACLFLIYLPIFGRIWGWW